MATILSELEAVRQTLDKARAVENLPIGTVVQLEKARRLLHSAISMARQSPAEKALAHEREIRRLYVKKATRWR